MAVPSLCVLTWWGEGEGGERESAHVTAPQGSDIYFHKGTNTEDHLMNFLTLTKSHLKITLNSEVRLQPMNLKGNIIQSMAPGAAAAISYTFLLSSKTLKEGLLIHVV